MKARRELRQYAQAFLVFRYRGSEVFLQVMDDAEAEMSERIGRRLRKLGSEECLCLCQAARHLRGQGQAKIRTPPKRILLDQLEAFTQRLLVLRRGVYPQTTI